GYKNSHDLHDAFYRSKMLDKDTKTLLESLSLFDNPEPTSILYLNSVAQSNAVFRSSEIILGYPGQNISDDPEEIPSDTLLWYCRKISGCEAAIVHFMSQHQTGSDQRNFIVSLIAGLIHGYEKPLYMLAQTPFETPSDMPDMIKAYATASQAEGIAKRFVKDIADNKDTIQKERRDYATSRVKNRSLAKVRLGEYLAENESESLSDYFVETGSYYEVINGTQSLFLGRKGTGKTACLYAARDYFAIDKRNLVITIKPAGYEVDGLIEILSNAKTYENQGYLVEDLWKYLVYSEICRTIVNNYQSNVDLHRDTSIDDLISFCESYESVILLPFSERLRNSIDSLKLDDISAGESFREYVGRKLHSGILRLMSKKLLPIINRYKVLSILIDNLDKGWHTNIKVSNVSQVIFGLLAISRRLSDDIRHEARQDIKVDIKMTIFLRSDIYTHIQGAARERDKLDTQRIEWNDAEVLKRVLDNRILIDHEGRTPEEIWNEVFAPLPDGRKIKDYVISWIRPRPRDAIYFVKCSINEAVSRGHARVELQDLESARQIYSDWAFNSLIDEDDPEKIKMKDIIYELLGEDMMSVISA
uniref:P-loop ATPase, Sll1717 family n=1 Tax=Deinococcus saxicola TaxID=249406 RepID=UPI003D10EFA9